MADNLCGPSNGMKTFISQIDRDRTLQQDRSGHIGSAPSFRSVITYSHGADGAFEQFANGGMDNEDSTKADHLIAERTTPFARMHNLTPPPGLHNIQSAYSGWVDEFATMSIHGPQIPVNSFGVQTNTGASALSILDSIEPIQQQQLGSRNPHLVQVGAETPVSSLNPAAPPLARPFMPSVGRFGNIAAADHFGHFGPLNLQVPMATQTVTPMAGSAPEDPSVTDAFERAFQAYHDDQDFEDEMGKWMSEHGDQASFQTPMVQEIDEHDFETEMSNWMSEHGNETSVQAPVTQDIDDDQEFKNEMNKWMAAHGPRASVQPPTVDEMVAIDADLEKLAADLDHRREAGDIDVLPAAERERRLKGDDFELRKAASDITTVMDLNSSERFQKSGFLALMRNISNQGAIIRNDQIVDATTGEAIVPMAHDDDVGNETPLSAGNDLSNQQEVHPAVNGN